MAALRTANDDLIDFFTGPAAIRPPKILEQGHSLFGVLGFAFGLAFEFCELFRHRYTSLKFAARGSPWRRNISHKKAQNSQKDCLCFCASLRLIPVFV